MRRLGILGHGFIGAALVEALSRTPGHGVEVAFVYNRSPERLAGLPPALRLDRLDQMLARGADLIVETAHPDFTRDWGERILAVADYMPLSLSALIDDGLLARLTAVAERSGRRLFLPHGALIGTDNLVEWRSMWDAVEITFVKDPAHIDFSASGIDPAAITERTVVYEGPVRGIAALFPRNVNTMVTCALATIGIDRCIGRLIAQPGSATASIEVIARGRDGAELHLKKLQPMAGVSGTEMVASTLASIHRAVGAHGPVAFV